VLYPVEKIIFGEDMETVRSMNHTETTVLIRTTSTVITTYSTTPGTVSTIKVTTTTTRTTKVTLTTVPNTTDATIEAYATTTVPKTRNVTIETHATTSLTNNRCHKKSDNETHVTITVATKHFMKQTVVPPIIEEFEDNKGAIRIRISKNRQHNGQKKKYK
jgi:hypothetical protein